MPTDSITCPEESSKISTAIRKFEHSMLVPKIHNVYNVYTKGEYPTPVAIMPCKNTLHKVTMQHNYILLFTLG